VCGFATTDDGHFILLGIYRPGSQALSVASYEKFSAVLERLVVQSSLVVICSDFNIHVDQSDDTYAEQFGQLLQSFGLAQYMKEPAHAVEHTSDLVITKNDTEITNLHVSDMVSDHAPVQFSLTMKRSINSTQWRPSPSTLTHLLTSF